MIDGLQLPGLEGLTALELRSAVDLPMGSSAGEYTAVLPTWTRDFRVDWPLSGMAAAGKACVVRRRVSCSARHVARAYDRRRRMASALNLSPAPLLPLLLEALPPSLPASMGSARDVDVTCHTTAGSIPYCPMATTNGSGHNIARLRPRHMSTSASVSRKNHPSLSAGRVSISHGRPTLDAFFFLFQLGRVTRDGRQVPHPIGLPSTL